MAQCHREKRYNNNNKNNKYRSYIRPILEYASTAYSSIPSVLSDKPERFQRKAARICLRLPLFSPVNHSLLLHYVNFATLSSRRKLKLALFAHNFRFKYMLHHIPVCLISVSLTVIPLILCDTLVLLLCQPLELIAIAIHLFMLHCIVSTLEHSFPFLLFHTRTECTYCRYLLPGDSLDREYLPLENSFYMLIILPTSCCDIGNVGVIDTCLVLFSRNCSATLHWIISHILSVYIGVCMSLEIILNLEAEHNMVSEYIKP